MLKNGGESGQPWRTPLLISTDFESLLLNWNATTELQKIPKEAFRSASNNGRID